MSQHFAYKSIKIFFKKQHSTEAKNIRWRSKEGREHNLLNPADSFQHRASVQRVSGYDFMLIVSRAEAKLHKYADPSTTDGGQKNSDEDDSTFAEPSGIRAASTDSRISKK